MFVFLALVFAVGFVAFGVGSDVQGGIADVIGVGGNSSGQPSVDDARERVDKNPNDAKALRDLATALQTDGRADEARGALARYATLRPKDTDALRELAALQLTNATALREQVQLAQYEAQTLNPGATFLPPQTTPLGQALSRAAITNAVSSRTNERLGVLYSRLTGAYGETRDTYKRIAAVTPKDASVQLQLADASTNAGDSQTALAAYRRFLVLAPDDPNAELVRQQITRLSGAAALGG